MQAVSFNYTCYDAQLFNERKSPQHERANDQEEDVVDQYFSAGNLTKKMLEEIAVAAAEKTKLATDKLKPFLQFGKRGAMVVFIENLWASRLSLLRLPMRLWSSHLPLFLLVRMWSPLSNLWTPILVLRYRRLRRTWVRPTTMTNEF